MTKTLTKQLVEPKLSSSDSLYNFQQRAAGIFEGFPTKHHENWLYWAPDETLQQHLLNPYSGQDGYESSGADIDLFNGKCMFNKDIAGLKISSNPASILDKHPMSVSVESSPLAHLNSILFEHVLCLHVTESIEEPVSISIRSQFEDDNAVALTRVIVLLEEGVSATFSVTHQHNLAKTAAANTFFESIGLKESSLSVNHVFQASEAAQFFANPMHLYEKAHCEQVRVVKGTRLSRQDTELNFHGENADAKLQGIALLEDDNQNFNHLKIIHHVKDCNCEQNFKAILTDKALTEFSGLVNVKPGAHGTDSTQSNKNLLLSDNARVLSRPQLMIDADDVECGHGSIIGQLNPEEIHYIRSRGLNEAEAKALLTLGFAEEILLEITDSALQNDLIDYLHKRLPAFLSDV